MIALVAVVALAADPPPCLVDTASATMTEVQLDGKVWPVAGPRKRAEFVAEIERRHCPDAVLKFEDWRRHRRATNTWLALAIPVVWFPPTWPLFIPAAIQGGLARSAREDLVRELQEEPPPPPPLVACEIIGPSGIVGRTTMEYDTAEKLDADEKKRAEATLREPIDMPDGGAVFVRIERITEETADPKWQTLVIRDANGAEIVRYVPESEPPNAPNADGYYSSTFYGDIPTAPAFPIEVNVGDIVVAQRCTWTAYADGTTTFRPQ